MQDDRCQLPPAGHDFKVDPMIDDARRKVVQRRSPQLADLLWLSFLALYLTPWITVAPLSSNWPASAIGTGAFLLIFLHSYRVSPTRLLPHIVVTAAIGFALAWFGGVWNVFNVLAAAIAGRLQPRRTALVVIVLLQIALIAFGLALRLMPVAWVSGIYFGILAAGTTMLLDDLDRRNRELQAAQGEIRRLTVTAERERIARDLHDLLGRSLTAIALKANLARRLIDRDPTRSEREIAEVAIAAREALAEVRGAVTGIVNRSIAAELVHAGAMLEAADIAPTIDVDDLKERSNEVVLAMVLREAVTNVVRHSGADQCRIVLVQEDDAAVLRVSDNGSGTIVEGFGIGGMRRRLAEVGGYLDVSGSASGTTLAARIPRGAA